MIKGIINKKDPKKIARRNQIVVGMVLILLMLVSTLGYSFQSRTTDSNSNSDNVDLQYNYNGYIFTNNNGFWTTLFNEKTLIFSYNPSEINRIDSNIKSWKTYENQQVYIDSENQDIIADISYNLERIGSSVGKACYSGSKCSDNSLPIKTCSEHLIVLSISDENSITQKDNCVFINGTEENLPMASEEFLFKIFGIV